MRPQRKIETHLQWFAIDRRFCIASAFEIPPMVLVELVKLIVNIDRTLCFLGHSRVLVHFLLIIASCPRPAYPPLSSRTHPRVEQIFSTTLCDACSEIVLIAMKMVSMGQNTKNSNL